MQCRMFLVISNWLDTLLLVDELLWYLYVGTSQICSCDAIFIHVLCDIEPLHETIVLFHETGICMVMRLWSSIATSERARA